MNLQQTSQSTSANRPGIAPVNDTSPPSASPECEVLLIPKFCKKYDWTEPTVRNLRHKSKERHSSRGVIPGNGLREAGAFIVIGGRVYINVPAWFRWVHKHNEAR
jgi:hypothetical protein